MKFKAVIFDLYGTLVYNFSIREYEHILTEMAASFRAPAGQFIASWKNTFEMRALGKVKSVEENIVYVCEELKIHPAAGQMKSAAEIRLKYAVDSLVPKPDSIKTLNTIKQLGYKIGLISDCSSETAMIWNDTPFAGLFDTALFSCVEHIKKPDIRIYRLVCDRLSVSPSDCLYVGDGSSNELSGAQSAGMFPVMIRDNPHADEYKVDEQEWNGEKIFNLRDILRYLK